MSLKYALSFDKMTINCYKIAFPKASFTTVILRLMYSKYEKIFLAFSLIFM